MSLIYLRNNEHNISILTKLYGEPRFDIGDSLIELDIEKREWSTTMTYQWIYGKIPELTDIKVVERIEKLKRI